MPRRILLVGKGESLHRAWRSRSFGLAGADLEKLLHVSGFALDDTYHPVRVAGRLGSPAERPAARGFRYARAEGGPIDTYAVRAIFDDEEAVHRLRRERGMDVFGVFADPAVSVFPSVYCGSGAIGTADDVARRVGVSALRAHGLTGKSVHVAVVDTGIDGSRIPVAGVPVGRYRRLRRPHRTGERESGPLGGEQQLGDVRPLRRRADRLAREL